MERILLVFLLGIILNGCLSDSTQRVVDLQRDLTTRQTAGNRHAEGITLNNLGLAHDDLAGVYGAKGS